MKQDVSIKVNGEEYRAKVEASLTLLDFIRENAGLTGTKKGCDNGDCGSCTVLIDGKAVLSCMMLAVQADSHEVTTIEGIASGTNLHPVQMAFVEAGAIQCGYCTPGMVMAAIALLCTNPHPNEAEIRSAMAGHLCRCSGYKNIVKAVDIASKKLAMLCNSNERDA